MKKKSSNVLWGMIFIFAGLLYILNEFCGIDIDIFQFWPLLIIFPCISSITKRGLHIGNSFWLLIGLGAFASSFNLISDDILDRLFIPLCLIIIGVVFIFRDKFSKGNASKWVENHFDDTNRPGYNAIFSSTKSCAPHEPFVGGEINSIFGGVVLDLRDAIITEDVVINCFCVFGGADIFVPAGVKVSVSGLPIFGGISDKTTHYNNVNAPTLYVNATCMFGGVNVK